MLKEEFKHIFIQNIYNELKVKLTKIAKEFGLNYEELENKYLKEIKEFLEQ